MPKCAERARPRQRFFRVRKSIARRDSLWYKNLFGCVRLARTVRRSSVGRFNCSFARRRADTPMPLHESEAIVLQSYPLGEADRLVSFLSRTMGRMRGVAAGARRTKSRFGSTLERLSHIRIWFFERETRELVRISQCEVIESFLDAFRDYASSVALALFSEITQAVLPDKEASDANFRLLLLCAQAVKRSSKAEPALAYFALWTVKLGGWLPALETCARCGRALQRPGQPLQPVYFSTSGSAMVCANCRRPGLRVISPVALAAVQRMLAERLDRLNEELVPPRAAREVTEVMLDVIEHQIDRKLTSRELLESA
jgi:DNA repair protein RecO (recombination protein O)